MVIGSSEMENSSFPDSRSVNSLPSEDLVQAIILPNNE